MLRRLDHANIFVIIAGTYTPLTVLLIPQHRRAVLLGLVWTGALAGVAFRALWVGAPRWLYTPCYLALGWSAVFLLPDFMHVGGVAVVTLIVVGGVLYTAGAVVYGTKRPDPSPRWFGFHEVFHTFTLAAFTTHYAAIALATVSRRAVSSARQTDAPGSAPGSSVPRRAVGPAAPGAFRRAAPRVRQQLCEWFVFESGMPASLVANVVLRPFL